MLKALSNIFFLLVFIQDKIVAAIYHMLLLKCLKITLFARKQQMFALRKRDVVIYSMHS